MEVKDAHSLAYSAVYEHFALQKVPELTFMLSLIEPTDTVIEIGCDAGGTTWALQEMGCNHYGIDLPGDRFSSGLSFSAQDTTKMIWGDSHKDAVKKQLAETLGNTVADILIIDGDHTLSGVRNDFYMYAGFCKGIVFFHDICHHPDPDVGVEEFYETIKTGYNHIEYCSEPMDWGGIGALDLGKLKRRVQRLSNDYADSQS